MSFASPLWLLLLPLALLVVVLHIRRRRNVEVSSVYLWRRVATTASSQVTWKPPVPNLLMLLQLLVVLSIILALAQPSWGGHAERSDHWIVVLDASGSMQASDLMPSRQAAAVAHLERDIERSWSTHAAGSRMSVVVATSSPYVAGARLTAPEQAAGALHRATASHGPANWQETARLLPGLLIAEESARVTVLTDTLGSEEAHSALSALVADLPVEVVPLAGQASNAALLSASVTPLDLVEGRWHVQGSIGLFNIVSQAIPVRFFFTPEGADSALEWLATEVETNTNDEVTFEVELSLPGPGVLEVRLPEDHLAHDNHAHFVLHGAYKTMQVLVVGPENLSLLRVLEAIPHLELFQADVLPVVSDTYDLVIVDSVRINRHPGTHALWLNVVPPEDDPGNDPALALADPYPSGWSSGHPLGASVNWSALTVARAAQMPRLPGAEVLLEASGSPLIQVRTTGYGREIVIAFRLQDSNWPDQLSFPAFFANLVRWIEPDLGEAAATPCRAGESCPLGTQWLGDDVRVIGPDGARISLPPAVTQGEGASPSSTWLPRGLPSFRPQVAGLYRLESEHERQPIAINAWYPSESDLRATAPSISQELSSAGQLPPAFWFWLLLLAMLALLVESWIAGRKEERFLHREALAQATPLATRRRMMLALRCLSLIFLLCALFELPWVYPVRERNAVIVVDQPEAYSESAWAKVEAFVGSANLESNSSSQLGVVRVGSIGRIERDLSDPSTHFSPANVEEPAANIEAALLLAASLLPEAKPGRVVLVSDGTETRGSAGEAIGYFNARGVPIDVYPVGGLPAGEVLVEALFVPHQIRQRDPFLLEGIIASEHQTQATVRVWREHQLELEQEVTLLAGRNRIEAMMLEEEAGAYLYEMEVTTETDVFPDNNRNGVVVEILAGLRVGIFTPQLSWGEVLADALEVQGIHATVLPPSRAPYHLDHENPRVAGWLDYDVVILMNVPAIDFVWLQQEHLETWVRQHGGGLIVLGGENTFGPGGYYQTPLEDILPLSTKIPQEKPSVALSFVLDRSGSMQQAVGEVTRLDIAKQAVLDAVELIDEDSLVGVVVFDSEATVLVPIQRVGDHEQLQTSLASLQAGGGTAIYPGLVLGYEQLSHVDDEITRHMVVMTDGLSQPGDFEGILAEITQLGITVSAVAIGQGADVRAIENIARWGGGAAHITTDFRALPSILAQEALLLSDEPLEEESFVPIWGQDVAFLQGLPTALPPLHGYVLTTSKSTAEVHLHGPDEAPLLASWRYGLGRVVALASQAVGPWASDWMAMQEYPLLWAQAVRWASPRTPGPGLELELRRVGDAVQVIAEAMQPGGAMHGSLVLEANVSDPSGVERTLVLREQEAGRYTSRFDVDGPGFYSVAVTPAEEDARYETAEASLYVAYPARYGFGGQEADLLLALANTTGGRVLLGDEIIFVDTIVTRWVKQAVWPMWAVLTLGLLMADLLIRYAPNLVSVKKHRVRPKFGA